MAAKISVSVKPFRLLTRKEGAYYCRLTAAKFEGQCPVHPVQMPSGEKLWDVRDLDEWIDGLKARFNGDDIIARLK